MTLTITKKTLRYLFALTFVLMVAIEISGCGKKTKSNIVNLPSIEQEAKSIGESGKNIGEIGDRLNNRANNLNTQTNEARSILDSEIGSHALIDPQLSTIDSEAQNLRIDSQELVGVKDKLDDTQSKLLIEQEKIKDLTGEFDSANSKIQELENENKELKDKTNRLFKEKMAWIGVISVFGIGVSVVLLFFTRSTVATMVALGFVATLGISITVSLYMQYIAWVTIGIVVITALVVVGYLVYKQITENKTVDELVRTGEITKDYLTQEAKNHIFGQGAEPGVADAIQSKSTRKLVKEIRRYNSDKKRGFDLASAYGRIIEDSKTSNDVNLFTSHESEKDLSY